MGKVQGNWLTGAHSGRACRHQNIYTKVDKKTGACYSVQLCNPNTNQTETQKKNTSAFASISAALSAWIVAEKAKPSPSAEFLKVKAAFNRQTRYSTLRGMMMAKGMYKVVDGVVVVDPTANTDFKTISSAVQLPAGSGSGNNSGMGGSDNSAQSPAAPDQGSDSGSAGSGGSSGGGSGSDDEFTEAPE